MHISSWPVLSDVQFAELSRSADILEKDANGIKVLRLADGNILKLFRVKRWWSSARLYPYSLRFSRNAGKLHRLGIPTVTVLACYRLSRPGLTGVLYHPLEGRTLRQVANEGELDTAMLERFGAFVANLHRKGVYFRSLHLGNVVLAPDGRLGLIDIADLAVLPWGLSLRRRRRNFRHLARLEADRRHFGTRGWAAFCQAYVRTAAIPERHAEGFLMHAQKHVSAGGCGDRQ